MGHLKFAVRRYVRGKIAREYGSFPSRGLAEHVAQRACEAHMGEAGVWVVEPLEVSHANAQS